MAFVNKEGDFARKQLEKQGWRDGKGLGKDEDGISTAIKVGIKNDTAGLGHNIGDQFTFHWWDHIFNKTANSIVVQESEDGVTVSKKEGTKFVPPSNKKPSKHSNKPLLYGRFVKASSDAIKSETDSESDSEEEKDFSSQCPEERLFQACGGRTAHKAARHGLKLNGKLKRIEEQEKQTTIATSYQSNSSVSGGWGSNGSLSQGKVDNPFDQCEIATKKRKKEKKTKHSEFEVELGEKYEKKPKKPKRRTEGCNRTSSDSWVHVDYGSKKQKKKKAKKKNDISEKNMNSKKSGICGKHEKKLLHLEVDPNAMISVETEKKMCKKSEEHLPTHSKDILLADKTSDDRVDTEEKKKKKKRKRKVGKIYKGNNCDFDVLERPVEGKKKREKKKGKNYETHEAIEIRSRENEKKKKRERKQKKKRVEI